EGVRGLERKAGRGAIQIRSQSVEAGSRKPIRQIAGMRIQTEPVVKDEERRKGASPRGDRFVGGIALDERRVALHVDHAAANGAARRFRHWDFYDFYSSAGRSASESITASGRIAEAATSGSRNFPVRTRTPLSPSACAPPTSTATSSPTATVRPGSAL